MTAILLTMAAAQYASATPFGSTYCLPGYIRLTTVFADRASLQGGYCEGGYFGTARAHLDPITFNKDLDFNDIPVGEPFLLRDFATYARDATFDYTTNSPVPAMTIALDLTFIAPGPRRCEQSLCYLDSGWVSYTPLLPSGRLSPVTFLVNDTLNVASVSFGGLLSGVAYDVSRPDVKYKFILLGGGFKGEFGNVGSTDELHLSEIVSRISAGGSLTPHFIADYTTLEFFTIPEPSTGILVISSAIFLAIAGKSRRRA